MSVRLRMDYTSNLRPRARVSFLRIIATMLFNRRVLEENSSTDLPSVVIRPISAVPYSPRELWLRKKAFLPTSNVLAQILTIQPFFLI